MYVCIANSVGNFSDDVEIAFLTCILTEIVCLGLKWYVEICNNVLSSCALFFSFDYTNM